MMEKHTLPRGWEWTKLEDVGAIASGGTPRTTDKENFDGDIAWITPADLTGYKEKFITHGKRNISDKGLKTSSARLLPKGSILYSSRAPIGYIVIAANSICTNQGFKNLIASHELDNEYIYYYLKGSKRLAESLASGTTFAELSTRRFAQIPIPIPPLNEQRRIVSKIEELFSDLDEGEAALKKAQKLIATYRQSVLKAAVTGELTKDWREVNRDHLESGEALLERILQTRREQWQGRGKYKEPQAPDTGSLPNLPEGWVWATPEQICSAIVDCPHSTPKWSTEGEICVRTTEFFPGTLKLDNVRYVNESIYKERIARLEPKAGDVLYSREGGILGIACAIPENVKLCMGQRMMLMRASISGRYLMHVLNSPLILTIVAKKTGGSASPHLNVGEIKKFPIPFPSEREQHQIVDEIEDIFSQISALETWCETELARSATLRQAILKDAFSGKLVPQDSTDEPASVLLERIKSDRATQVKTKPSPKRGRRKPAKQLDLL